MKTRRISQLVAAAVVASLALLAPVTATSAWADQNPSVGDSAEGNFGEKGEQIQVKTGNGTAPHPTILFDIKVGDKKYQSYCIERTKRFASGAGSVEEWDDLGADVKNKVGWVLENSYPKVDVKTLAQNSGVEGLTEEQAIAATQGAVWHFTEPADGLDTDLNQWDNKDSAEKIIKLYEYLIGDANTGVNFSDDNGASVELNLGGEQTHKAGEKVGPITITSSQETVTLQAEPESEDYKIVNKDGEEVDLNAVKPGELYVQINEDAPKGSLTLTATSSADVLTGRVFTHSVAGKQRVVLIDTEKDVKKAEITLNWDSGDTPPAEEETPPAEEETPPAEEETPPAEEETPPAEEETPPAEEETPPAEEETPPAEEETPPAEEEAPNAGDGSDDNDSPAQGDEESSSNDGSSDLPRTGAEFAGALVAAIALIAGGVVALFVARRKQNN